MNQKQPEASLYEVVFSLLETNTLVRSSDKHLIWNVYFRLGLIETNKNYEACISFYNFYKAPTPESITRCRRKIQESHPELQASKWVKIARNKKEATKGNFVYQKGLDI